MHSLRYEPATPGAPTVQLDGPLTYAGQAMGVRGREWDYRLGYRDLLDASRPARDAELEVVTTPELADEMRRSFDADVANGTPGTLVALGKWRQRALVVGARPSLAYAGQVAMRLDLLLLDGAWRSLRTVEFRPVEADGGEWLDYPHPYPHGWGRAPAPGSVDTGLLSPCPVRLVVYGPAVSPYVVVGRNRYEVETNVPEGAHLVVDGAQRTIVLVGADGTRTDCFAAGVRGTGAGGGEYVFEPVRPGEQAVSWDNSFGFDLGWYAEEGEPPWSPS